MGPLLIAIAGPTGSGKTSLALELASIFQRRGGPCAEIVNCDSLQLYRGFDIGTAKTPGSSRREIPHHLFDVLEAGNGYSAGDYARLARPVIAQIVARKGVPIVVGGSGFYLRALLDGLPELPSRDPAVRARLESRERLRPGSLHRLLNRLEPAAAKRIHYNDIQKVTRAFEIRLLTQSRLPSRDAGDPLTDYRVLKIGLDPERSLLNARLDARVEAMFSGGLIEEVHSLLARGATGDEKPFESLGYRQAIQYIRSEIPIEEAIASTKVRTRQYAKRQWTWFRRDPEIRWLDGFGDQPEVVQRALELVGELFI